MVLGAAQARQGAQRDSDQAYASDPALVNTGQTASDQG